MLNRHIHFSSFDFQFIFSILIALIFSVIFCELFYNRIWMTFLRQLVVTVVPVIIERKQGSGTFGTANVAYSTLAPAESYPFLPTLDPTLMRRADYSDYEFVSGVVTFGPGQTSTSVNVSIKANNLSQPDSVVFLRLSYVSLVLPQQPRPSKF